jgi:hypothetical protein
VCAQSLPQRAMLHSAQPLPASAPRAASRRRVAAVALPVLLAAALAQRCAAAAAGGAAALPGVSSPSALSNNDASLLLQPPPPPPLPPFASQRGGVAGVTDSLDAASGVFSTIAAAPPALPSSFYASFGQAATIFPQLRPLQPKVDALAAPPGPPIFSTVDPTAIIYHPRAGAPAAADAYANATVTSQQMGATGAGVGGQ